MNDGEPANLFKRGKFNVNSVLSLLLLAVMGWVGRSTLTLTDKVTRLETLSEVKVDQLNRIETEMAKQREQINSLQIEMARIKPQIIK